MILSSGSHRIFSKHKWKFYIATSPRMSVIILLQTHLFFTGFFFGSSCIVWCMIRLLQLQHSCTASIFYTGWILNFRLGLTLYHTLILYCLRNTARGNYCSRSIRQVTFTNWNDEFACGRLPDEMISRRFVYQYVNFFMVDRIDVMKTYWVHCHARCLAQEYERGVDDSIREYFF